MAFMGIFDVWLRDNPSSKANHLVCPNYCKMPVEAWEGMQRQRQDIADHFNSLTQGFNYLLHSHMSSSRVPGLSIAQVPNESSDCNQGEQGIPIWPWSWPSNQQRKRIVDRIQFNNDPDRQAKVPIAINATKGNGATAIPEHGLGLGQSGIDFEAHLKGIVQHVARHFPLAF